MRLIACAAVALLVTITSASAEPEGTKFILAFKYCTEDYATKLARSGEPVETIVTAAFAFCASIESDLRRFLLGTIRNVDAVDRVINENRQKAREHLTLLILTIRQGR